MFDEIRSDLRIQPRVSVVITLTAVLLTIMLIYQPQLKLIYGVHDIYGVPFSARMTVPFCHGYSVTTSLVHLVGNLIFMYFLGTFLEKVVGGFRFLLITLASYVLYVLIHRVFLLIGNGFTPFLMTYSGVIFIVLSEGRYVKTNSVFDDYYKTLWAIQGIMWIILPVIFTTIPIYFDAEYNFSERLLYGNIANVVCGLLGIGLGAVFRQHIRNKLVQRTRKKYIKHEKIDDYSWVFAFGFLGFIVLRFFI